MVQVPQVDGRDTTLKIHVTVLVKCMIGIDFKFPQRF